MSEPKSKVRVLFATASTTGGGAERMLFNIIRSLDDNHEIRLFVTSTDRVPLQSSDKFSAVNACKTHAISAFGQLLRTLKQFKPHHVFTTSSNVGYMLVLAKKILRAKFKIFIRCAVTPSEIYHSDIKNRMLNQIISITYNDADLIIAQTDFMRDDLIKSYHIIPDKVRTIRNIVDKQFVESQSGEYVASELRLSTFNIVAAGALYSVKGFDLLVDAIAPIMGANPAVMLYILGEERYEVGYKDFLADKIKSYGLQQRIHLLGHKSNPYPYLKGADLFVMSSRKEGFPNVVLEALTLGTPVVATRCVDFTGTIEDGVNGYVVDCDVESIRNGLNSAINSGFDRMSTDLINFDYNQLFD